MPAKGSPMYLTTFEIYSSLEKKRLLPKACDPMTIKDCNFRYFKKFDELNAGVPMSDERFMNKFIELVTINQKYEITKMQKERMMKQIDDKAE